jgi:hypothetical protein
MEFRSAEELLSHYDAVRMRLYGPKKPPNMFVAPRQPEEEKAAPEPSKGRREAYPDVEALPPLIINPTIGMPPEDFVKPPKTKIYWSEIVNAVVAETGITREELLGPRRNLKYIKPRHLLWAVAYVVAPHMSVSKIGKLSNRDHTTILWGYKKGMQHPSFEKLKAELLSRLEAVPELEGEGA